LQESSKRQLRTCLILEERLKIRFGKLEQRLKIWLKQQR